MQSQKGFTLVELIIVIVILGVLSVVALPKFIDISNDAREATFKSLMASFKFGVDQVHIVWQIKGNGQAQLDFINLSADGDSIGNLSVNQYGFPADTRGVSLTLNSDADCLDVFRAVLMGDIASDDVNNLEAAADYTAKYLGSGACTYTNKQQPELNFSYFSRTGRVVNNS